MVKIAVVVTARPSYSRVRSLLLALKARPEVDLQVIVCASALLERYGRVVDVVRQDGIEPAAEIYSVVEGETLETSAKSTGLLLLELGSVVRRLHPALGVVHADRFEVLAAGQAFRYQEIPFAHLQGGEVTGSVDDRVRDAITQLADYHLVSTTQAARRLLTMRVGNLGGGVWVTGCPSLDLCVGLEDDPPVTVQELGGAGIDLSEYDEEGALYAGAIVLQHPTSDRWQHAHDEMQATLDAVFRAAAGPVVVMWPGNEAGMDGASKAIRQAQGWAHTVRNLPPRRFLKLLTQARVLVGNSSCGIRECSFLGVPVVNIGQRQRGRERAGNVLDCLHFDASAIRQAIDQQVQHGRYPSSTLYGDGQSGERMAEVLIHECCGARAGAKR